MKKIAAIEFCVRAVVFTALVWSVFDPSRAIGETPLLAGGKSSATKAVTLEDHIRGNVASREEVRVFLNEMSWAQFDPELGYILGNYMPRDGLDDSSTFSTAKPDGARTSFLYKDATCRINSYGNSFTQCHQVSDGETWQEYLAGHLGEPVRNFGMGGFGIYQSYRRMLREEKTDNAAPYVLLYIWGDDHIRSLFRCRYMAIAKWNRQQDDKEGVGSMFHGNFWSNIEMDLESGKFHEFESRISKREDLYKMTDADWMVENLKDDLALEMDLYARGDINVIEPARLKQLDRHLQSNLDLDAKPLSKETVGKLLDAYSFSATKVIMQKAQAFAKANDKELMTILFDPYRVMRPMLEGQPRYDQEVADYLSDNGHRVFDMNLVYNEDYKAFNLSVNDYFNRYFIGHYNPAGNHFFAYSIKDSMVEWLDPKPLPYRDKSNRIIDFRGYLRGHDK